MNMRLILNGYLIQHYKWKSNGDSCLCCWINSEVYKQTGGHTRRTARSHFGCCCYLH